MFKLDYNFASMKRNNSVIAFLLFSALHSFSQDSVNISFPEQKRCIDSIILEGQKVYFRERTIAGIDSVIHTYKGSVVTDQSNLTRRINIQPDSSAARIILFCKHDKVLSISENGKRFYKIKDGFYNSEGSKETSKDAVKRFAAYDSILSTVKVLFE